MSLKISVRQVDNVAILDLSGRITLGEASGALRDAIKDALAKDHTNILLNLADVTYIDSSGLGELVGAFATVNNRGGRLKVMNVQKRVHELMQITKLYSVFEVHGDEASALRSFQSTVASA